MKRPAVLLALIAAVDVAAAARIAPRGPIYVDDVIEYTVDAPPGRFAGYAWRVSNGRVRETEDRRPEANELVVRIFPQQTGPLTIEAEPIGNAVPIPPVTVTVQPDFARATDDLAAIFRQQRAAGRPLAVVRAMTQKSRYVRGEIVEVVWVQQTPVGESAVPRFGLSDRSVRIPGVEVRESYNHQHSDRNTTVNGVLIRERVITVTSFLAKSTGDIEIPSHQVEGDLRANPVIRWTPPLRLQVVERPPVSVTGPHPVGRFALTCSRSRTFWPVVLVGARGSGDLTNARPPRFTAVPSDTIVIHPESDSVESRQWQYVVHAKGPTATFPPLEFRYYDPDAGSIQSARCEAMTLTHENHGGDRRKGPPRFDFLEKRPSAEDSLTRYGMRIVFYVYAMGIAALVSTIVFISALRD
jgi:hypothetical protein